MIGAATNDARTEPAKTRSGCDRIRFAFNVPGTIRSEKFAEVCRLSAANSGPAMRQIIGPDVLFKGRRWIQWRAGLQQDHVQPASSKDLPSLSAGRTVTNDADVVRFRRANYLG